MGKQYTNKFLNIGPNICQDFENNITETGGDSGDNFLVPDPGPFLVPDPRLFLFCTSHFSVLSVADSGCLFDNFLVADPDPGKSEGGDSREVRRVGGGGGWAEDMEGRSVLSLTLVYIIFFDCSRQPAS